MNEKLFNKIYEDSLNNIDMKRLEESSEYSDAVYNLKNSIHNLYDLMAAMDTGSHAKERLDVLIHNFVREL